MSFHNSSSGFSTMLEQAGELRLEASSLDLRDSLDLPTGDPIQRKAGRSSLKILVVDDETTILEYIGRCLSSRGHSVYSFAGCNTGTALTIVEAAAAVRFDVAIVDVVMPGIDGMELIEFIHRVSPSTQFISSDCGACVQVSIALMERGILVRPLLKPFEVEDLDNLLKDLHAAPERDPKAPGNWIHDEETTLRNEIEHAVIKVLCTHNPGGYSFIGTPCDIYAPQRKAIADFVWRKFPYPSEEAGLSVLIELISLAFEPRINSALCAEMAREVFLLLPPSFRGANFQLTRSIRPYARHCSWCAAEIAKKEPGLLLYGVPKHRPRFCSKDCFENWDSIYWQRSALQRFNPSEEESDFEKKQLKRQKRLMGHGWLPARN